MNIRLRERRDMVKRRHEIAFLSAETALAVDASMKGEFAVKIGVPVTNPASMVAGAKSSALSSGHSIERVAPCPGSGARAGLRRRGAGG
jgi:hypothetical protein